jgi:hypothetical protein
MLQIWLRQEKVTDMASFSRMYFFVMTLGFTQPLTEMSTRSITIIMFLGSEARPVLRANNLTAICVSIV